MPPPRLEVHTSKTRMIGLLALGCLAVGMSVFCTQLPRSGVAHLIFGWFGACFFSLCLLASLRQFMRKGPVFIIDKNGIEDRRSRLGLIEWADINSISINFMGRQKFLCVEVAVPEKYLGRLPAMGRRVAKANRALGMPEIALSFGGLTHTINDAWTFLNEHYFSDFSAPDESESPATTK